MRRDRIVILGITILTLACTSQPRVLPPIEPWGDVSRPYGDAMEAAALAAMRPSSADTTQDLYADLPPDEREARVRAAKESLNESNRGRTKIDDDMLDLVLFVLRTNPTNVMALEMAALAFAQRGQLQRAHALACQGLRLEPESARLWGVLAMIYMARGDDERAKVALEQALEIDPAAVPDAGASLAALHLRKGNLAAADSIARSLPATDSTVARFVEAMQARSQGDLATARAILAQLASRPDAQVAIVVEWGRAEMDLGHRDVAIGAFERVLTLTPENAVVGNLLGAALRQPSHPEAAIAQFQHVVDRHPEYVLAQFNLAVTCFEAAQSTRRGADSLFARAERAFSACIAADYETPTALEGRGQIRLRRNDPAGARADARALLGLRPQSHSARLLAARAALAAQQPKECVEYLSASFAADSSSVNEMFVLGRCYQELDLHARAATVFERLHARDPDDWRATLNLGASLSQSDRAAAAVEVLRPLAAARPDDPDVLQNLAAALQRCGKRREADDLLERADRLRAGIPPPH